MSVASSNDDASWVEVPSAAEDSDSVGEEDGFAVVAEEGEGDRKNSSPKSSTLVKNTTQDSDPIQQILHQKMQVEDAGVVVVAFRDLHRSVANARENEKLEENRAAAIRAMVVAMKKWPREKEIQSLACHVFSLLSMQSQDFRNTMRAAGALDAIVAALKQHPEDSSVQSKGVRALRNAAFGNKDNVTYVVETLKGLEFFASEEKIQKFGRSELSSFLCWKATKQAVYDAEARRLLNPNMSSIVGNTKHYSGSVGSANNQLPSDTNEPDADSEHANDQLLQDSNTKVRTI